MTGSASESVSERENLTADWKLSFNTGGVGTFLPVFFNTLERARASVTVMAVAPDAPTLDAEVVQDHAQFETGVALPVAVPILNVSSDDPSIVCVPA
eukprot:CAMPEP_0113938352 /NCGR_PEP_ID=MMETSP1339-20121228/4802_1 /TAXON_ID=94617 /ORGANISM="Fibrocapsa japonica" /LENGTH=96 /DNA_ID=CAMNT_0000941441 /DNA_START=71 /DNA_END=357 /DNA_ORIENTATION=+ /assembly_acc=CAM_ASM_000762